MPSLSRNSAAPLSRVNPQSASFVLPPVRWSIPSSSRLIGASSGVPSTNARTIANESSTSPIARGEATMAPRAPAGVSAHSASAAAVEAGATGPTATGRGASSQPASADRQITTAKERMPACIAGDSREGARYATGGE